ncbi:nucleotidyltransferase family protein [Gemmatimonadota bacterium]
MVAVIDKNQDAIKQLCIRYKVRRLELFGSAAEDSFDPRESDIDLLVEFDSLSPVEHADAFFGMQQEMQEILGLPVDLIERAPIRNPYFLQSIDRKKVVLYAAA